MQIVVLSLQDEALRKGGAVGQGLLSCSIRTRAPGNRDWGFAFRWLSRWWGGWGLEWAWGFRCAKVKEGRGEHFSVWDKWAKIFFSFLEHMIIYSSRIHDSKYLHAHNIWSISYLNKFPFLALPFSLICVLYSPDLLSIIVIYLMWHLCTCIFMDDLIYWFTVVNSYTEIA